MPHSEIFYSRFPLFHTIGKFGSIIAAVSLILCICFFQSLIPFAGFFLFIMLIVVSRREETLVAVDRSAKLITVKYASFGKEKMLQLNYENAVITFQPEHTGPRGGLRMTVRICKPKGNVKVQFVEHQWMTHPELKKLYEALTAEITG